MDSLYDYPLGFKHSNLANRDNGFYFFSSPIYTDTLDGNHSLNHLYTQ